MENKPKLKKLLRAIFTVSLCFLIWFAIINIYEYNTYKVNYNNKLCAIMSILNEKYPELSDNEIIKILNSKNKNTKLFEKYGIDIKNESIIIENDKEFNKFLILNILSIIAIIVVLVALFIKFNKNKDADIASITKYIEQINKRNYALDIDSISEDELSILKNEIYKTTVMLKEIADNSIQDKVNLKKSLEDISHQLKTPLTSILVVLDNLIDDENMDKNTRASFIRDIKKEVSNINFLVQAILKLSKFDSNTISFIREQKLLKEIVDESIKNVSTLCDLKNISIDVSRDDEASIYCDFRWQVEAITNIIKNCVEHSPEGSNIIIKYDENNAYAAIKIQDFGEGISKEDLPHIFERFYKGKNDKLDSIGIGLALSKTIIENDNGNINVESNSSGTKFVIKYFKW